MSEQIIPTDAGVALANKLVALSYKDYPVVAFLFETPEPGLHLSRAEVLVMEGKGFAGDHAQKSFYKGRLVPGREVTAMAAEVLEALQIEPSVVGDNLITRGLDLARLEPGDRIALGDVVLVRSDREHRPCATFRARTSPEKFEAVATFRNRGTLFTVVQGGKVRVGDAIHVLTNEAAPYPPQA